MTQKKSVLVAASGGVDSSFALFKLQQQGYHVHAVHLRLVPSKFFSQQKSNPQLEGLQKVCEKLKIPLHIENHSEFFFEKIIQPFVQEYKNGFTPNPCTLCNRQIKWTAFKEIADRYGLQKIATGHYSKVIYNNQSGRYELFRDPNHPKDQTYMLWRLNQDDLKRSIFPLQGHPKEEIVSMMASSGLDYEVPQESQDICFIPDDNYVDFFLQNQLLEEKQGDIVDQSGKKLGEHYGYWKYTIGQRRGLGIAHPFPLYVTRINAKENLVIVGPREKLDQRVIQAKDCNFIKYKELPDKLKVVVKSRYHQQDRYGYARQIEGNRIQVDLEEPITAVAPGQSLVLYEDNSLVAGGVIYT